MKKITVAILFGGHSTEYEVSLQSACSVIENMDTEKYQPVLLGITREGKWLQYSGELERIRDNTWYTQDCCVPAVLSPDRGTHGMLVFNRGGVTEQPIDVAFPILHGKNGEDGTVQGLLEIAGIPCVGCSTLSSALCMDKEIAHRLVRLAGIKTPECVVLRTPVSEMQLLKLTTQLRYPLFVKPVNAGSSVGITKVFAANELLTAVNTAFQYDSKVIIEESVAGFEVGCAVLGRDTLTVGEVDEIELSEGFFDYTEKYTLKTSKIHMPARVDYETSQRIKQTAKTIYRVLECSGFARVDLFYTPEHQIVFNEVNTIPGFTAHSRYPSMLKGIGMTFPQIIDQLIKLAVRS